jgi:hypothetical protein
MRKQLFYPIVLRVPLDMKVRGLQETNTDFLIYIMEFRF